LKKKLDEIYDDVFAFIKNPSINIFKDYTKEDFHIFILSFLNNEDDISTMVELLNIKNELKHLIEPNKLIAELLDYGFSFDDDEYYFIVEFVSYNNIEFVILEKKDSYNDGTHEIFDNYDKLKKHIKVLITDHIANIDDWREQTIHLQNFDDIIETKNFTDLMEILKNISTLNFFYNVYLHEKTSVPYNTERKRKDFNL